MVESELAFSKRQSQFLIALAPSTWLINMTFNAFLTTGPVRCGWEVSGSFRMKLKKFFQVLL
jgi:hypothetical protein